MINAYEVRIIFDHSKIKFLVITGILMVIYGGKTAAVGCYLCELL